MNISIIIPNYNGESLLKKNLPKVYDALLALPAEKKELIISDDNSQDNSLQVLNEFESAHSSSKIDVIILENRVNKGFSTNVNRGVKKASGDIFILLNTDVLPDKDSFLLIPQHFEDPLVFAVGCMDRSIEEGKEVLRGRGIGYWQNGFLVHNRGEIDKKTTLWASGGSSVFRRTIWEKLGGLDEIYNPFYWEDIDLSYRALKAGFSIIFDSQSVVTHEHEKGSIKKKYTSDQIRAIAFRNQLLFTWKNITDMSFCLQHIVWLPYHVLISLVKYDKVFLAGFAAALLKLPQVIDHRMKVRKLFKLSDHQVLENV